MVLKVCFFFVFDVGVGIEWYWIVCCEYLSFFGDDFDLFCWNFVVDGFWCLCRYCVDDFDDLFDLCWVECCYCFFVFFRLNDDLS